MCTYFSTAHIDKLPRAWIYCNLHYIHFFSQKLHRANDALQNKVQYMENFHTNFLYKGPNILKSWPCMRTLFEPFLPFEDQCFYPLDSWIMIKKNKENENLER